MTYTYRYATEKDIDAIVAIEKSSMPNPWHRDNYLEAIQSNHAFIMVVVDGNAIAGFAVFYMTPPESELPDIVVVPSYRGKGIGKELLNRCICELKSKAVDTIFLEVRPSNNPARSLYTKMGFEEIGKRKYFYTNPIEDAICMVLRMEDRE